MATSGIPATKNSIFCPECGQENSARRGACVICYAHLHRPEGAQSCPNCGHGNAKDARFCTNCGNPFSAGATRPPTLSEAALSVLHGGVAALTRDSEPEAYYDEDSGFLGQEAAETLAGAPPPPTPAPPPAPAPVYEEDEMGMPPRALDVAEPAIAPPPPPPAAPEFEEEEFLPPPPPPGLIEEEVVPAAPPPPPPVLEEKPAPAAPPPAAPGASHTDSGGGLVDPLAQAASETADEDFGDWSLEMGDDKSSSSS